MWIFPRTKSRIGKDPLFIIFWDWSHFLILTNNDWPQLFFTFGFSSIPGLEPCISGNRIFCAYKKIITSEHTFSFWKYIPFLPVKDQMLDALEYCTAARVSFKLFRQFFFNWDSIQSYSIFFDLILNTISDYVWHHLYWAFWLPLLFSSKKTNINLWYYTSLLSQFLCHQFS